MAVILTFLRELEEVTLGELQQGSATQVLLVLKVRPEVPPSAGFTHVRLAKKVCTIKVKIAQGDNRDPSPMDDLL